MPGNHDEEERERKKRVNKLKARTSKMRLAAVDSPVKKKKELTPKENELRELKRKALREHGVAGLYDFR